jgi:hypothetical protein
MKETKPTHGYRWLIRSAYCRRMRRGSRQKNGLLSCSVKSAHVSSMMRKSAPDGAAIDTDRACRENGQPMNNGAQLIGQPSSDIACRVCSRLNSQNTLL